MEPGKYKWCTESQWEIMSEKEALKNLSSDNCADDSYEGFWGIPEEGHYDDDDDYIVDKYASQITYDVWEIYGEDETSEDYPDGDPYAARIKVAPDDWEWASDGDLIPISE